MAKYSYEFKKQIALEYLGGEEGYRSLAFKHGLADDILMRHWAAAYKKFGDDGLKRSRNNTICSFEKKLYYGVVFYSYEELKSEIERYIKYCNELRIKEKPGGKSPGQYRLSRLAA